MRPIVPCPHMPRYPTLLKKMTPNWQVGSAGSTSNAPTRTSDPRGSFKTVVRKSSWSCLRRDNLSATEPVPRSNGGVSIRRVGSPPVCESKKGIRFIGLSSTCRCADHQRECHQLAADIADHGIFLFPRRDEYPLLIMMGYYHRPGGEVKKFSGRPKRGSLGEKPHRTDR